MSRIDQLPTPALVLDLDRTRGNIRQMAARAEAWKVGLRPHFKTHKCVEVAELQRTAGIQGATVSTLAEARAFADAGFDDLTWAFPVIPSRLPECVELNRSVNLRLVVDSVEGSDAIADTGEAFDVLIKVDSGYHRAGVDPHAQTSIDLVEKIVRSATMRFDGLLSHSGHAYSDSPGKAIAEECREISTLADALRARDIPVPTVSVGSTPGCCAATGLPGVTEMRPGNYVFFDYTQACLGSCEVRETAVSVVATVVSSRPDLGYSIIDAGALALSVDPGPARDNAPGFGEIFSDYRHGVLEPSLRLVRLSQEHGVVNGVLPVGSRLRILPNHSCLAVACFDEFNVAQGETIIGCWKIHRERS